MIRLILQSVITYQHEKRKRHIVINHTHPSLHPELKKLDFKNIIEVKTMRGYLNMYVKFFFFFKYYTDVLKFHINQFITMLLLTFHNMTISTALCEKFS